MKLAEIYGHFQSDIKIIEKELEETIQARHEVLRQASTDLLHAGGKRIRPVFVLLAARFGTYDIQALKHIAVSLELIHMASLVHDDVIDDADLRRGKKTIKSQWDNRVAMYAGDYIFAKAVQTAAYFDSRSIHLIISDAIMEMCIGEVEQIRDQFNWDQNLRTYFRRIKRKTALLIAVSCKLGAIAANAPIDVQRRLYLFGYYVGMSFQITDDILDFVGTMEQLGKPAGGDLRQGNVTLPALYAMYKEPKLKTIIQSSLTKDEPFEDMTDIINQIKASGGIEYAVTISDRYLQKAFDQLEALPDVEAKTYFLQLASYIGRRKF
ncbi:heptaprenyl diphosphate synthase component II [Alkalicoccobacillus porphyridii]|uniref:Heptaprenyl diphosphate synthase component 2 n=1 Tax=Alkalicoccobacillus porphyridii TaxID=2597270 RepID=A0A553ZZP9_9BACI|nr:heptaprenyl diphosphate synthase component II [Alkalicoccobacillus porphyridii]TSB46911.1 heptaprenyl diphosphate synthase component II [Alkalicoccobacillus porphyridii]